MAQEFTYNVMILEHHLDTFGHVNNATYLELYEEARWDFITARGWGLMEIQMRQLGPVILSANITFKRELLNRETITIHSQSQEMKNRKVMQLNQWMVKDNGKTASTLELEVGLLDMRQRKLVGPTEEWLKAIGMA